MKKLEKIIDKQEKNKEMFIDELKRIKQSHNLTYRELNEACGYTSNNGVMNGIIMNKRSLTVKNMKKINSKLSEWLDNGNTRKTNKASRKQNHS